MKTKSLLYMLLAGCMLNACAAKKMFPVMIELL